jgi:hypothetical protein
MNLFTQIFAPALRLAGYSLSGGNQSRREASPGVQPGLPPAARLREGSAPGDCFPHVIGDGSFHGRDNLTPWGPLSPGKIDRFTPARALDMRASREGAR